MKIAIQGHPTRGKEVIQILESLGGINTCNYSGNNSGAYYELHGNSIICMSTKSDNIKYYTLEEFETEFPFKIGDKVITSYGNVGIIRALTPENDEIPYCVETEKGYIYRHQSELKPYKEMEKRNITLTLEKAKEWYKKGGELKEVALQAFTENELNPLPRSWEEFCKRGNPIASWRYTIPVKYEALFKLEQLRDCWWDGWEPDWNNGTQTKYYVYCYRREFKIGIIWETRCFLSFPTKEMAEEFLECFRDLIEKAGDLI